MNTIVLNNQPYSFTLDDLPLLVHGSNGTGASLYTMTLISQLYEKGYKFLILCGYPFAANEFAKQTASTKYLVVDQTTDKDDASDYNAIFTTKENTKEFFELLISLPDILDRVVVIKNTELFSQEIFDQVRDHPRTIISGDIETCDFKEQIMITPFITRVLFSELEGIGIQKLAQYEGYSIGKAEGITSVQLESMGLDNEH